MLAATFSLWLFERDFSGLYFLVFRLNTISPYFVQIRENVDEEKAAYLEAFLAVINVNILLDLLVYNVVSI